MNGIVMIKEYYQVIKKEQVARIENSNLHHVEMNQVNQTTLRLFLNGKVGLAKAEGQYDDLELEKSAFQNVKEGPSYLAEPTSNQQIEIVYNYMIAKGTDFVADMRDFIDTLKKLFPAISFRNYIQLTDHAYQLFNNNGVFLSYQDHFLDMNVCFEYMRNGVTNTGCFLFRGRRYEKETFLIYLSSLFEACLRPYLSIPDSPLPVIISTQDRGFFSPLISLLSGDHYRENPSRFSTMQNNTAYHPSFSFYQSNDPEIHFIPFFDAEAVVNPNFRVALIQDGKVVTPYTNKEIALSTGLPLTGSSRDVWGSMPVLSLQAFDVRSTHQSLSDILQGGHGLLLHQVHYEQNPDSEWLTAKADHVYLTDGKTIFGLLPPVTISVPWREIFSDRLKGVTTEPIVPFSNQFGVVFDAISCQW